MRRFFLESSVRHPCLIIRILFLTKTNKTLAVTQKSEEWGIKSEKWRKTSYFLSSLITFHSSLFSLHSSLIFLSLSPREPVFKVFLCVSAKIRWRRICPLWGEGGERLCLSQALTPQRAKGLSPWRWHKGFCWFWSQGKVAEMRHPESPNFSCKCLIIKGSILSQ